MELAFGSRIGEDLMVTLSTIVKSALNCDWQGPHTTMQQASPPKQSSCPSGTVLALAIWSQQNASIGLPTSLS